LDSIHAAGAVARGKVASVDGQRRVDSKHRD